MPRNVRNFWIDANFDGRDSTLSGGPAAKDGGFTLHVRMRDEGKVTNPVTIEGWANDDGTLTLNVFGEDGRIHQVVTTR